MGRETGKVKPLFKKSTGEGSRGGKVIGHTKSGKAIYDSHDHEDHKAFTKEDHEEAHVINTNKAVKLLEDELGNPVAGTEALEQSYRHAVNACEHLRSAGLNKSFWMRTIPTTRDELLAFCRGLQTL